MAEIDNKLAVATREEVLAAKRPAKCDALVIQKERRNATKTQAVELTKRRLIDRQLVSKEADKRISSKRLLSLPEDMLIIIKSFFMYDTLFELLETNYPVAQCINKLSSRDTHKLILSLYKRPGYLTVLSVEQIEVFRMGYIIVPSNNQGRKENIQSILQEFKQICPTEAIYLIKTLAVTSKVRSGARKDALALRAQGL